VITRRMRRALVEWKLGRHMMRGKLKKL
jgi:hypothetical protein